MKNPILFLAGILLVFMGIYPLASGMLPQIQFLKSLPIPGSQLYQAALMILGLIAVAFSLEKKGGGKEELLKALLKK